MENNNQSSSNKIYLVIIGILVVVIIAMAAFFLLSKKDGGESNNSNSNSSSTNQSNSNSNSNTNMNEEVYVVDADYVVVTYTNKATNEITTAGEQIKVPTVKFDTEDARKVNEEIQTNYKEYEERIKKTIQCEISDSMEPCGFYSIGYKTYETDSTISIVVLMEMGFTSVPIPDYLVYNFDKNTGKLLTINDLLTKTGMTKEALIEKTMKDISAIATSEDYNESGMDQEMGTMRTFVTKNIDLNKTKITDGDGIAYFFDETGKLNAVTTLICPNLQDGTLVKIVPNSAA